MFIAAMCKSYLHSTMVRFIIKSDNPQIKFSSRFTFHYGQIYYSLRRSGKRYDDEIYIPLWLDLLSKRREFKILISIHLHSTMVRFIILTRLNYFRNLILFTFHYGQIYYSQVVSVKSYVDYIYIPLWLDLLFEKYETEGVFKKNLHSTMVRFIIYRDDGFRDCDKKFTFHYGQIYYSQSGQHEQLLCCIYIPLWLDLLLAIMFVSLIIFFDLHSTMVRFIISLSS